MIGLGTIINGAGIMIGGICGLLFGKFLPERHQNGLYVACGISVLFIGIAGTLEGMLTVNGNGIESGQAMLLTISLALGALVGEILNIESAFERFGTWLRNKTGNANDSNFVHGFVVTSMIVSIGAMAIIGAMKDGIEGDYSILATKAVLDFVMVMVMTASLGKGCVFSFIPVVLIQGTMTGLAVLIKPIMTDLALAYLSMVGSALIFCIGINLVFGKKVRVANLLPALLFAVGAAFLPFSLG